MSPPGSEDQPPGKLLNACPACGQHLDVSDIEPFSKIECPTCEQPIRVRTKFDHFSLRSQVGEGGMSRVFQARDETLGRDVALKILNRDFSRDSGRIEQFEREARITASISHPNVVKLYSVGKDQGFFYLAMELIDNASLEQELMRVGRIPEGKVLDIAIAVVDGLRTAFHSGLIHRDLKPGNILLDSGGTARIVDFGLALMVDRDVDESGEIWATPFYVPPEKLHHEPEDFRSDIYSLGATLFHLLAGEPPFRAETSSIEDLKKMKDLPVAMARSAPDISSPTCQIIDRMMMRQPSARFQTYSDLYDALKVAKGQLDGTIKITDSKATTALLKSGSGKREVVAGLALTALVAAVVLMVTRPWESEGSRGGGRPGDPGSSAVPVRPDGKTTSDLFREARQALLDGNYRSAFDGFREIASAESTLQPTKNRARMNAGICALLEGRESDSRVLFEEIYMDGPYSDKPEEADLARFYVNTTEHLIGSRPVDFSAARDFDKGPEQASGLLACGLKNWELGALDSAVQFFEVFETVELPEQMSAYKSLTSRYLADHKLLVRVPPAMDDIRYPYCEESLSQLEEIRARTQTQGYVLRLLGERIAFFNERKPDLKKKYDAEQAELSRQRLAREGKEMETLLQSLSRFAESYRIDAAIEALGGADFSVDEIRAVQEEELALWKQSEQFLDLLVRDLKEYGYKGDIARRNATPIRGEVVDADRNALQLKVGRATTKLRVEEIPPGELLSLAQKLLENISDSDAHYLRRELYVSFARQMGMESEAVEAARELLPEKRDFRDKWRRITGRKLGKSDL